MYFYASIIDGLILFCWVINERDGENKIRERNWENEERKIKYLFEISMVEEIEYMLFVHCDWYLSVIC